MVKGGFDKDLDDYLKVRSKKRINFFGFVEKLKPKVEKKVDIPEEVEIYDSKDDVSVGEPDCVNKGKEKDLNVFNWLFKRRNKCDDDVEGLKFEVVSLTDDIKEVSKIALTAIKKLPDDKLAEFKKSAEFERLKRILQERNLIKA